MAHPSLIWCAQYSAEQTMFEISFIRKWRGERNEGGQGIRERIASGNTN